MPNNYARESCVFVSRAAEHRVQGVLGVIADLRGYTPPVNAKLEPSQPEEPGGSGSESSSSVELGKQVPVEWAAGSMGAEDSQGPVSVYLGCHTNYHAQWGLLNRNCSQFCRLRSPRSRCQPGTFYSEVSSPNWQVDHTGLGA